jgi:hypothetical protein
MVNLSFSNQKAFALPKPTEVVDTTLRFGPAAQASLSVVNEFYRKKDSIFTFLKEFSVDLEEMCAISLVLQEHEDGSVQQGSCTLSENADTIAPVAPGIFSSNQLRSPAVSSSGRITI